MKRIKGIGVLSIHDTIEFMHTLSWQSFSLNINQALLHDTIEFMHTLSWQSFTFCPSEVNCLCPI